MPHLEQLQSELAGKVKAVKINAPENPDLAGRFRVMSVPVVILFHQGKAAERWSGLTKKEVLKAKVEQVGAKKP